jgi:AraC family L-rhamnose operon transcriptional activator RhaR/AraC family L-rhamnose operon regulatory protein RhaS
LVISETKCCNNFGAKRTSLLVVFAEKFGVFADISSRAFEMQDFLLSREYFQENYRTQLEGQRVPLVYARQSYEEVRNSGLHLHEDHYAFYLVHSGRGLHEINGHPYAISRGDVYLTPPGAMHAYRDGENLEVDTFVFPIELLRDEEIAALRAVAGFRKLFVTGEAWSSPRLHLSPERWQEIEGMVREVRIELLRARQEYSCGDTQSMPMENLPSEILSRTLFYRLLIALSRLWTESTSSLSNGSYQNVRFADIIRFCEEHYAETISVPQLAARMFLSPSRFAEIFKSETGVPPGEYLRRLRLDRAQVLLRTSTVPASDVARECGFSDAAQFSRAFKNVYGVSPSEYRASHR